MKHLRTFNENNQNRKNIEMQITGLKCDNCDYSEEEVPFAEYESSIGRPCPKCGESLLTQEDYDSVVDMLNAMEIINGFSPEELDAIAANLSPEEIDATLDVMNDLKMKKIGETEDGREKWDIGNTRSKK